MPKAQANGINLYYEILGTGTNLVLIEGLGYHSWMWYCQIPAFPQHFRTLIYDNRGVGQSDAPPGSYSHEQNAADLAGLLDQIGWDRAHVLGVSMGGFIAQEFALRYPERLEKLILVATGFGGRNMVPVTPEAVQAMLPDPRISPEERMRRGMRVAFGNQAWPDEHAEEFERIISWRLEHPQSPEAATAQFMAGLGFDAEGRLRQIQAPTLVITGTEDRVVPPRNAELLAASIPGAKLDVIPGAGHLVFIEGADRFNQDVIAFLTGKKT